MDLSKPSEATHILVCAAQGLSQVQLSESELRSWLEAELSLWEQVDWPPIEIEGIGTSNQNLVGTYTKIISKLLSSDSVTFGVRLRELLATASQLDYLILQSPLGTSLRQLSAPERTYLAILFTAECRRTGHRTVDTRLSQQKALLSISPMTLVATDLANSRSLRDLAVDSIEMANRTIERIDKTENRQKEFWANLQSKETTAWEKRTKDFDSWLQTTQGELEAIKDVYHKHVQTEAAAIYWQKKSINATILAWIAFTAFGIMVGIALSIGWTNLAAIKSYVQDLANSSSTVSLAPVILVTVPVLAYAWILRHLSRVFIQNLALADDAAYRRLMTMTFLGLSRDPASGVTQAERAIILNALFRPAPPNTNEDGPPTGLLDIINNKKL